MGNGIERLETLVDGDFEDRRRWIERAIDRVAALAVPATTDAIGAFAAVPGRSEGHHVEKPHQQVAASERRGRGSRVGAVLEPLEMVLDDFDAGGSGEKIDRPLLVETDLRAAQPGFGVLLRAKRCAGNFQLAG